MMAGTSDELTALGLVADLRKALGDPLGRLMQDELVAHAVALVAERDRLRESLALVQQHHATAWARGHERGMAANRSIAREAQEALWQDAWGNTQLTEALMAAESECEALRKDAERYRWLLANYARGDGYDAIDAALNNGEADTQLSPAIDAAMALHNAKFSGGR